MNQEQRFSFDPEQRLLAAAHPLQVVKQGTELLQHLEGFEDFWVDTRSWVLQRYPLQKTSFLVVWGLTGAGKLLALSEISLLADKDPVLVNGFARQGQSLRQVCTHFSSSANLAKARGLIEPSRGHGQYSDSEYRSASVIHTEYTVREFNNYEGPTLVTTEPSGPTAEFDPDGTMKGTDRAISTIRLLAQRFREDTRLLILMRGEGVVDRISQFRENIIGASWNNVPDVLNQSHLKIFSEGQVIDLKKLTKSALLGIKDKIVGSMAPPEGIKRSNDQTYQIMREEYGTDDESVFWPRFLRNLGFTDYTLLHNVLTDQDLTLNLDLLDKYDPMLPEIESLRRAQGRDFLSNMRLVSTKTVNFFLRKSS